MKKIIGCKCQFCGETDCKEFYGHKKTVCGDCHNQYTTRLGKSKRDYAIQKLGGCCVVCGYNKFSGSLDIHHLNPAVKDSRFKNFRGWSIERIKKEIENCVLLCRNCHNEHHYNGLTIL